MLRFAVSLIQSAGQSFQHATASIRQFHAVPTGSTIMRIPNPFIQNPWSFDLARTIIRNHFPRPSERKRIKVHGWKAKLSTKNGRRMIMRRILKGRWYITH